MSAIARKALQGGGVLNVITAAAVAVTGRKPKGGAGGGCHLEVRGV